MIGGGLGRHGDVPFWFRKGVGAGALVLYRLPSRDYALEGVTGCHRQCRMGRDLC
jgi:hypothetical protein